jgi:trigger factor
MQVSIEDITDCKRRVTIEIPANEIQQKQEQKMQEFKGASVKGFRPGKAPINIILQQIFGGQRQFRASVVHSLLQEKFSAAVEAHEIDLADSPQLDELNDSGEGDVTFTTICDVYPKFELLDFKELELTKRELTLAEDEYQEQLDLLLKSYGTWDKAEGNYQAQAGDLITVDFTVLSDNEAAENNHVEQNVEIILDGKVRYGFENGLLGMRAGESKIIDHASSNQQFDVKVIEVIVCTKAEIDDQLAEKLGIHCAHDIREYVEDKATDFANEIELRRVRAKLLDLLVEKYNHLPLPEKLLERYKAAMNAGEFNAANMGQEGISPDEQAHRAVILDLLREKIAKKFDIKVDEQRVIEHITKLALSVFGNYDLVLELYSKNPALLNQVRTLVLDEQITKLVLEHAKLNIEKVSLAEIKKLDEKAVN